MRGNSVLLYRYVYSLPESESSHVLVHYTGLDDELDPLEAAGEVSPCKKEEEVAGLLEEECEAKEEGEKKDWKVVKGEDREEVEDVTTVLNKNGLSVMGKSYG